MKLGKEVLIEDRCEIIDATFGRYCKVGHDSVVEKSSFQDYSYCEPFCMIQNTKIMKFCDIARSVRIGATQHPMNRATTHHMTYRSEQYGLDLHDDEQFFQQRYGKKTIIDYDVWIGHGAVIQAGVHVGIGAVVGSHAVVTKNVPPYAIVAGAPARIIRFRFPPDIIEQMLNIRWWLWEDDFIREHIADFRLDATQFIKKYGEQI